MAFEDFEKQANEFIWSTFDYCEEELDWGETHPCLRIFCLCDFPCLHGCAT